MTSGRKQPGLQGFGIDRAHDEGQLGSCSAKKPSAGRRRSTVRRAKLPTPGSADRKGPCPHIFSEKFVERAAADGLRLVGRPDCLDTFPLLRKTRIHQAQDIVRLFALPCGRE